jgi:uncharacterized protein
MVNSTLQLQFGQDKADNLPQQCIQCSLNFACHGACPKHRFYNNRNGEPNLNYLCSSYKEFFEHIKWPMTIMASLFNHKRAPAEVMSILNGELETLINIFPYVGRNDPCPCGSGAKFKKCHGKVK